MAILVDKLVDVHTLDAIAETLSNKDIYIDGKATAGRTAKRAKYNLQADSHDIKVKGALKLIKQALLDHKLVASIAWPEKIVRIMANRYEVGMHYGAHIDAGMIENERTDISFTLFLNEPNEYQGGELVIENMGNQERVKPARGSLALYPTNAIHEVTPVTQGVRLAIVGWIKSRIRDASRREILFDLQTALQNLPETHENEAARLMLLKTRHNLIRHWLDQ